MQVLTINPNRSIMITKTLNFGVKDYSSPEVNVQNEIINNLSEYKIAGTTFDGDVYELPDKKHVLKKFKGDSKKIREALAQEKQNIQTILKGNSDTFNEIGISIAMPKWNFFDTKSDTVYACYEKPNGYQLNSKDLTNPEIAKFYRGTLKKGRVYGIDLSSLSTLNNDTINQQNRETMPFGYLLPQNLAKYLIKHYRFVA